MGDTVDTVKACGVRSLKRDVVVGLLSDILARCVAFDKGKEAYTAKCAVREATVRDFARKLCVGSSVDFFARWPGVWAVVRSVAWLKVVALQKEADLAARRAKTTRHNLDEEAVYARVLARMSEE